MDSPIKKAPPDLTWLSLALVVVTVLSALINGTGAFGFVWGIAIVFIFWLLTIVISLYNAVAGYHKTLAAIIIIAFFLILLFIGATGTLFSRLSG